MFGWRIRLPFANNNLWYNGKKDRVLSAKKDEEGFIYLDAEYQSCWGDENDAVVLCNHDRALKVKRGLGDKAEVVEYENNVH